MGTAAETRCFAIFAPSLAQHFPISFRPLELMSAFPSQYESQIMSMLSRKGFE
jgi:hypothetical protein